MQGKLKKDQAFAENIFDEKIGIEDITKSSKRYKILKVGYGNKNPNVNAFQKKKNKKK